MADKTRTSGGVAHIGRRTARVLAQRKRAWLLKTEKNLTFMEIGKQLGVSNKTAWEYYYGHIADMKAEGVDETRRILDRHQLVLDKIIQTHLKRVASRGSAEILVAALSREAKLHGLDKSTKVGFSAEQVVALVRAITGLFLDVVQDPGLRRKFSDGLRRRLPGPVALEAAANNDEK